MKVKALHSIAYDNKSYVAGDEFELKDEDMQFFINDVDVSGGDDESDLHAVQNPDAEVKQVDAYQAKVVKNGKRK